ncbi:MAG: AAA family ATPase [Deltaproteobacteria bacterium]|nr:AAA family ATPase [Deltaproteobacteria bacterium]
MAKHKPLAAKKLRNVYDPNKFWFESTEELAPPEFSVLAQKRAVEAINFGMGMGGLDHNVYVAGPREAGMGHITRSLISDRARREPPPPDWVYVHNFKDPDRPRALQLPQGRASEFAKEMAELIEDVKTEIPELFESEDYSTRRDEVAKRFHTERTNILQGLEEQVKAEGFILNISQVGMVIIPAKEDKPLEEADLAAMNDEDKEALRERSNQLQTEMGQAVRRIRKMEKGLKEQLKDLDRRVALFAVGHMIDELQEKYADQKPVLGYLKEVKNDIIINIDDFKQKGGGQQAGPFPMPSQEVNLTRYEVNVLVDNSGLEGAPVIFETNPSFTNLFGSMERKAQFGALFTDFTMLRAGALHRANGCYLILRTLDLLKWWVSYEALKRALRTKEINIEDASEIYGLITTKGMKPEPLPMNVKVILMGDPIYYQLLYAHDEAFAKLFKVKAHLDHQIERKQKTIKDFALFVRRIVDEHGLLQVHKSGVARLVDKASKVAASQEKMTLQLAEIADIIREADYCAREAKSDLIRAEHVHEAIRQKTYRCNLYEERLQEYILKDVINIQTKGTSVGQVNGLSVYMLGDYAFGRPSRITATVSPGKGGTVSIDRESKMSGNIHTKGVLILGGYLRGAYAQETPLSLTASLAFEQSYGMVDGDSASGAELYAILSAVTNLDLAQGIACTGAISQKGELQAIGGVNEKIEGHFEVCQARGLTGEQGVIIPKSNSRDLMLKPEVVEACEAGKFHVWAVDHVDKAMEILTGLPAGKPRKDGTYHPDSIHGRVMARLKELAEKAKALVEEEKKTEEEEGGCASCGA